MMYEVFLVTSQLEPLWSQSFSRIFFQTTAHNLLRYLFRQNFSQLSICLRGVMRVGVMTSEITWDGNGINKSDTDAAITELSNYILDASASVKAWASPWGHQWWPPWPRCWSWPRLWSASTSSQGLPSWSAAPPAATLATAWRSIRWWRGRAAWGAWRWWGPRRTTAPSQEQPGQCRRKNELLSVWVVVRFDSFKI